jgi:predicted outer membrane repeat protein
VSNNTAAIAGGGINTINGPLTIEDSIVSNNTCTNLGGGIFINNPDATVKSSIKNSTVSNNVALHSYGGGIGAAGDLTVSNSTFSNNTGQSGGGIGHNNFGGLRVANCTFSNNTAIRKDLPGEGGGGISNEGPLIVSYSTFSNNVSEDSGGGILGVNGAAITNCTFSGNSASHHGGGVFGGETMTVTNCTFSGNSATLGGGGIYNAYKFVVRNTILANSPVGGNCSASIYYPLVSQGHNLSSDHSCADYFTGPGDLNDTDPLLGPLADNGGPTLTFAPLPGSPAIDSGDNSFALAIDQRGFPRIYNGTIDIGSVEVQSDATPPTIVQAGSGRDAQGFAYIDVKVQDAGSGLQTIHITRLENATASVPSFSVGTTAPVIARFTSNSLTLRSYVGLTATDVAGNVR